MCVSTYALIEFDHISPYEEPLDLTHGLPTSPCRVSSFQLLQGSCAHLSTRSRVPHGVSHHASASGSYLIRTLNKTTQFDDSPKSAMTPGSLPNNQICLRG